MAADKFDTVNTLSILLGGRRPEWIRQIDAAYPNGLPDAGSGVALRDSPRTQVLLRLREEIRHRTSRVAIRVLDLTGIYRIFIDANPVDFDAGGAGAATTLDVLQGWRDAINAAGAVNTIVTASLEDADGDGTDDTLMIKGDTETDYSIGVTMAAGTAELDVLADPTSSEMRIYMTDKPPKAQPVAARPDRAWGLGHAQRRPIRGGDPWFLGVLRHGRKGSALCGAVQHHSPRRRLGERAPYLHPHPSDHRGPVDLGVAHGDRTAWRKRFRLLQPGHPRICPGRDPIQGRR